MNKDEIPIFIVGCRRSGTTLMLDVLNNHPRLGLAPETHFIAELLKKLRKIDVNNEIDLVVDILFSVKTIPYNPYWQKKIPLSKQRLKDAIYSSNSNSLLTYKEIFRRFLVLIANLKGKKRYGEKSPKHTFYVSVIKKWFPQAKIIQMIRDPRAVAASHIYRVAKPRFPYFHIQLIKILRYWLRTAKLVKRYENIYKKDYILIKFEDLVTKPEETIKKICNFIDEEYSQDMLKPSFFLSSFGKDKKNHGFEISTLNKWMKKMPTWSIKIINFVCSPYMNRFGYNK